MTINGTTIHFLHHALPPGAIRGKAYRVWTVEHGTIGYVWQRWENGPRKWRYSFSIKDDPTYIGMHWARSRFMAADLLIEQFKFQLSQASKTLLESIGDES